MHHDSTKKLFFKYSLYRLCIDIKFRDMSFFDYLWFLALSVFFLQKVTSTMRNVLLKGHLGRYIRWKKLQKFIFQNTGFECCHFFKNIFFYFKWRNSIGDSTALKIHIDILQVWLLKLEMSTFEWYEWFCLKILINTQFSWIMKKKENSWLVSVKFKLK